MAIQIIKKISKKIFFPKFFTFFSRVLTDLFPESNTNWKKKLSNLQLYRPPNSLFQLFPIVNIHRYHVWLSDRLHIRILTRPLPQSRLIRQKSIVLARLWLSELCINEYCSVSNCFQGGGAFQRKSQPEEDVATWQQLRDLIWIQEPVVDDVTEDFRWVFSRIHVSNGGMNFHVSFENIDWFPSVFPHISEFSVDESNRLLLFSTLISQLINLINYESQERVIMCVRVECPVLTEVQSMAAPRVSLRYTAG